MKSATPGRTPEERELEKKLAELSTLEGELAEGELELATLQNDLDAFEARYFRVVRTLYAELAELEAQIAEAEARQHPKDSDFHRRAAKARADAANSAHAVSTVVPRMTTEHFTPDEALRRLYRDIAKALHPDFATDDHNRSRRTRLMADVNEAYAAADEARLRAVFDEWVSSPEAVEGEGIAAELVRTIRRIHQVEQRLKVIAIAMSTLAESERNRLRVEVANAEAHGRALLTEWADQLKREIALARRRLANLSGPTRTAASSSDGGDGTAKRNNPSPSADLDQRSTKTRGPVVDISADDLAPVIKLVNVILLSAIQKGATDVVIEPAARELFVRYRIDGVLYDIMQPPLKFRDAILARVKQMARLDPAEHSHQESRIDIRFIDGDVKKQVGVIVACQPTRFGENIRMSLLPAVEPLLPPNPPQQRTDYQQVPNTPRSSSPPFEMEAHDYHPVIADIEDVRDA